MARLAAFEHTPYAVALVCLLPGCLEIPPTTGGTTDLSDTAQPGGDELSATGLDGGVDETAGDMEQPVEDHRTYFIGESVRFDGGGECEGSRLNTVTQRLRRRLDDAGWNGLRFVDDNSWPEDFWDTMEEPLGLDESFGDAHRLVVYAGHGLPGKLQWGRPSDNGQCKANIPNQVRLGRFGGDTAAAVMLLSSCTLATSNDGLWPNFKENAARQIFGFHDSPHVASREARDVFKRTQDGQSTKDAWLDEMETNIAPGRNSPVVLTTGVTGGEAMVLHGATNLASGEGFILNVGEPADAFFFELLDNGCTPGCDGCSTLASVGAPMPSLEVGSRVPIVAQERPRRSSTELVERASELLELIRRRPMGTAQQVQLGAWARRVVREDDIGVVILEGSPRAQLAYDPSTDYLVVDDLDARDSARPMPGEYPDVGRERAELEVAQQVRDETLNELEALGEGILGVPRRKSWTVGTRKAGTIESGVSSGAVSFETIFSAFGEHAGYPVFGARLEIGVTRRGELSRIGVSAMNVTEVATAEIRRSTADALHELEQHIAAANPAMLRHEILGAWVGFVSPGGRSRATLVAPDLAVDYVVLHSADDSDPMVSRRHPVQVSLVSETSPHPRHEPEGVNDDPGDPRP